MLERDYKGHFLYIFIFCPTLEDNKTYQNWKYLHDPKVYELPCVHDDVERTVREIVNFAKNTNSLIILGELVKLGFRGRHIGFKHDRHHATTHEYCQTVQDEHFKTCYVLQLTRAGTIRNIFSTIT